MKQRRALVFEAHSWTFQRRSGRLVDARHRRRQHANVPPAQCLSLAIIKDDRKPAPRVLIDARHAFLPVDFTGIAARDDDAMRRSSTTSVNTPAQPGRYSLHSASTAAQALFSRQRRHGQLIIAAG